MPDVANNVANNIQGSGIQNKVYIDDKSDVSATKVVREYFPETWLWNIEILEYIRRKIKGIF